MTIVAGKPVGRIGFGLMGLTRRPEPPSFESSFKVMRAALEKGANLWSAGEFYGPPHANSLHLLHAYFSRYPEDADKVVLAVKGGLGPHGLDGSSSGVRDSVENCLRILDGTKDIDIFECVRVDPTVPIEETMAALEELRREGKIRGVGLSEVRAETIRRAASIAPIAAVETELSLWSTDPLTNGIVSTCAELGIPIVAYAPLGRGFLTGQLRSPRDIPSGDIRGDLPRFQEGAFDTNLELVDAMDVIAQKKSCSLAQVALGWVVAQGKREDAAPIVPIPGAASVEKLTENMRIVELTNDELREIADVLQEFPVAGSRYSGYLATLANG